MFDHSMFQSLLDSSPDVRGDRTEAIKVVREQLADDAGHLFYDVNGDGTLWHCTGLNHGVGWADAYVEVTDEGKYVVTVDAHQRVSPEHAGALRKLFGHYNAQFKLRGLEADEGHVRFVTLPQDPVNGRFDAAKAVSLALSTIHGYASVALALEAGAEPWDLFDADEPDGGRGGRGGDDPGEEAEDDEHEGITSILSRLLSISDGETLTA